MSRKEARKKLFVNGRIQGRAMLRIALYWALYHVVLWQAMFLYHYLAYRVQLMSNPDMTAVSFAQMYTEFFVQHQSLVFCAAAVFPLILWDMLKLTHRIAGPLVRFEDTLQRLTRGEKVERVKIRKGDLLQDFEQTFNAYLHSAGLIVKQKTEQQTATGVEPPATSGDRNGRLGPQQQPEQQSDEPQSDDAQPEPEAVLASSDG